MKGRTLLNISWLWFAGTGVALVFVPAAPFEKAIYGGVLFAALGFNLLAERIAQQTRRRRGQATEPWVGPMFPIRCLICGEVRSYHEINVQTRQIPDMPIGSSFNIQHCKDRDACWEGAKTHNPLATDTTPEAPVD